MFVGAGLRHGQAVAPGGEAFAVAGITIERVVGFAILSGRLAGALYARQRQHAAVGAGGGGMGPEAGEIARCLRCRHHSVDGVDHSRGIAPGMVAAEQVAIQTLLHERLGGIKHFGRGAAEAINALLGVAHDEDAGRIGSTGIALQPGVQRLPLQRIGVLKFINQQMAHAGVETLLQPAAEGGVLQ